MNRAWFIVSVLFLLLGIVPILNAEESAEKRHWNGLISKLVKVYRQGRYQEGISIAEQAYGYALKHFGETHPHTLASMNNLAGLYESQGRYGEAEPLYKEALQGSKRVLGKEHPDTLTLMNNLALLYKSQGRYGEAEPLCKESLQVRERVLGKEHPDTLISMNNLALFFNAPGLKPSPLGEKL